MFQVKPDFPEEIQKEKLDKKLTNIPAAEATVNNTNFGKKSRMILEKKKDSMFINTLVSKMIITHLLFIII